MTVARWKTRVGSAGGEIYADNAYKDYEEGDDDPTEQLCNESHPLSRTTVRAHCGRLRNLVSACLTCNELAPSPNCRKVFAHHPSPNPLISCRRKNEANERCYQQPDDATILAVVLGGAELREVAGA